MSEAPNTTERCSAYIPALQTLMVLRWSYLSFADCLGMRGEKTQKVDA